MDPTRVEMMNRLALRLAIFTVSYNLIEGVVSVMFAAHEESAALLGFGADSFVESLSGGVMIWRFWKPEGAQARERRAARLVGLSLLVLAIYVIYEAVISLAGFYKPHRSLAALIIAAVSLVVMPILFFLKHQTAKRVRSRSLLADARQTLACVLLSVALLVGAGLNWVGIWQADAIAAILIALYLLKEAWEAMTTHELCNC